MFTPGTSDSPIRDQTRTFLLNECSSRPVKYASGKGEWTLTWSWGPRVALVHKYLGGEVNIEFT